MRQSEANKEKSTGQGTVGTLTEFVFTISSKCTQPAYAANEACYLLLRPCEVEMYPLTLDILHEHADGFIQ